MSGAAYNGLQQRGSSYERRIILVGKTGVGKSAAGNTILGREAFESDLSPSSQTSECYKAKGVVGGRGVAVIDTPGLFDTNFSQEDVMKKIKMCISLSSPGPHVFLLVLQLNRFTDEEREAVRMIQTTFGESSVNHTMVLFTHGDQLKKQTIYEYVSKSNNLQHLIRRCHGRYHVFNNEVKDQAQTRKLLDKIDKMTMENGGGHYTNEMFAKAEEAIEKEKARLLRESQQQREKELAELRVKCMGRGYAKEERLVYQRYEVAARTRAERSNAFLSAPVIILATACGAGIGAVIGAVGGPIGLAVGLAAGAAIGAGLGALTIKASDKCSIQ